MSLTTSADGIARPGALAQRRAVDRQRRARPTVPSRISASGRDGVAVQLAENIAALQRKRHCTVTVSKLIIIHTCPTHTAYSQLK